MKLQIFLGYQFNSKYYNKNTLEKAIIQASDEVQLRLTQEINKTIRIEYKGLEIDSGEIITNEVLEQIRKSDICIFEVSDKNANVFFELGYAYAKEKEIIYLLNDELDVNLIPSDFDGRYIDQYKDNDLRIKLSDRIYQKANKAIENYIINSTVFDFNKKKKVFIIISELPKNERMIHSYPANENFAYRLKFGDPDALHELIIFLNKIFPKTIFYEYTCSDIPTDVIDHDLIILGGPGLNSFAENIISEFKLPLKYKRAKVEEKYVLVDELKNKEYSVQEIGAHNKIDYGFFAKLPNPNHSKSCYYLFNGILTHGVLGTVRLFTQKNSRINSSKLLSETLPDESDYFLVMTETNIINGSKALPKMIKKENIIIYDQNSKKYNLSETTKPNKKGQ